MIQILEKMQSRFLELNSQKLVGDEKEEYMKALFDMRNGEVSEERLEESEATVMSIVKRFGKLLIIGDQLTVQSIECAIESRKDSSTDFKAFAYIMDVRLGDFHMEMNATIKNIGRLMPDESGHDPMSFSHFAHRQNLTI